MTTERMEEIMKATAYPESNSVYQALLQMWTEVAIDTKASIGTCETCTHGMGYDGNVYQCTPMYEATGMELFQPHDFSCNKYEKKD